MATIAELIIAARVDPAGIAQGLGEGTRILENYGQEAATIINAAIGSFDRLGKTIDLTNDSAVASFRAQGDQLASNLVQLGATDTELNKIGASITRVERAAGAAASQFTALHVEALRLNADFDRANALAITMQNQARSNTAGNILSALTGGGAGGGLRAATQETAALGTVSRSTMIGVSELARGIGRVAQSGQLGAGAMREFTGAAFRLGAVLGSWGEIIAIAATVGYAIYQIFDGTRKQIEQTRKTADDEIKKMMDDFNQIGLEQKLRQLEIGSPSAGVGEGGGYVGSMRDLRSRMNEAVDQMNQADREFNYKAYHNALDTYNELKPQWDKLKKDWDTVHHALLNPEVLPGMDRPITGLASTTVNVNSPVRQAAEDAKEAAKQLKTMNDEMAKLFQFLNQPGSRLFLPTQVTPGAPLKVPFVNGPQPLPTPPGTPPGGFMHDLIQDFSRDFDSIGQSIRSSLVSAMGPVALLFKALEPGLRVLSTLFDKLAAPLTAVVEVIAAGLEPVFRLLFPIVRDVAIGLTYLQEIIDRVVSGIARLVGNIVTAIGALIAHIPFLGGLGKSIENLGKSFLNYSDGLTASANEMAAVRKRLEAMQFGDTADSVAQLGDAAAAAAEQLNNVPTGYKAALDYLTYVATAPVGMAGSGGASGSLVPAGGGGAPIVIENVNIDAKGMSAEQIFDAAKRVAQRVARSQFGNVARADEVWNH